MTGWQNFWTLFLLAGMGVYVLVVIVVGFAGASDAMQLLFGERGELPDGEGPVAGGEEARTDERGDQSP